jgi:hypothetical protein
VTYCLQHRFINRKGRILDRLAPATSDGLGHPVWCDPDQCTVAGPAEFHPTSAPPAHWGRQYICNPPPKKPGTEVTVQLVRYPEDLQPTDFIRMELGDFEGRQSFYLRIDQSEAIVESLSEILVQAQRGTSSAAKGAL